MRVVQNQKFFIVALFMLPVPIAIFYAFNHDQLHGASNLTPYSITLLSGFLAVISVNIVLAFYIYLALREPAEAKTSINQSTGDAQQSSQPLKKQQ